MRRQEPEFIIDEEPLPLTHGEAVSLQAYWASVVDGTRAARTALQDLEEALSRVREDEASARRSFYVAIIEDVVDNLDRMIADAERPGAPDDPATTKWLKRARSIRRSIEALLARQYVAPQNLVAAGVGMEIVDVQPRGDVPEGTVLEVLSRGWLWKGEVLRKMQAIVAAPPDDTSAGVAATEEDRDS